MFPVYLDLEARSRCLCFWELPQERSEQAVSAKSAVLVADCNPPIVRAAFGSPWSVSAALHAILPWHLSRPMQRSPVVNLFLASGRLPYDGSLFNVQAFSRRNPHGYRWHARVCGQTLW